MYFGRFNKLLLSAGAAALAMSVATVSAETIKIGASAPKTGPLAGGSTVTYWPNVKLWVEQVNARGGIKLKGGRAKKD